MPIFSLRRVSDSSAGSKASRVSARLKAKAKRALKTVRGSVRGVVGVGSGAKHHAEEVVVVAAAVGPSGEEEVAGRCPGSPEVLSLLEVRRIHEEFWRALRVVEARGRGAAVPAEDASSSGSEPESEEEGEMAVGVPPPFVEVPRPSRPWALQRFLEEHS